MDDYPFIRIGPRPGGEPRGRSPSGCTLFLKRIIRHAIKISIIMGVTGIAAYGQRVGLVLSGGGALGLAHIGVMKAMEENGIPIDYIVGTSMGGILGAFYAAGYSPEEMEKIVLSPEFQDWVSGNLEDQYRYMLFEKEKDAAITYLKLGFDVKGKLAIKSSFVKDNALNFALAEHLSRASAKAGNNFDSLMIPFRCITTDIFTQTSVVMKEGNLSDAVKATMNIPMFFSPVKVDGRYLFDGGIYDNFPVKPMQEIFAPDVLIGVNVSSVTLQEYPYEEDEKYLPQLLDYLLIAKSDSAEVINNGIYLQPYLKGYSGFDFKKARELIHAGYTCTMAKMDHFEEKVKKRISKAEIETKRAAFRENFPGWNFSSTELISLTGEPSLYSQRMVHLQPEAQTLEDIKKTYFRLAETGNFESLHPTIIYDTADASYHLRLQTKPNRSIELGIGGSIASRNISHIFMAMNYKRMAKYAYTLSGSVYAGPFYNSMKGGLRVDFPTRIPFYLNHEFVYNIWDFVEVNEFFFDVEEGNTALSQNDFRIGLEAGVATGRQSALQFSASYFINNDRYSPLSIFQSVDTLSRTRFSGTTFGMRYRKDNLNRKKYASKGTSIELAARYVIGKEQYTPGSQARVIGLDQPSTDYHQWYILKFEAEKYFKIGWYSLGAQIEAVTSNQPFFNNYVSTLVASPAYYPLQDSRSLFVDEFRSFDYVAVGMKHVFNLAEKLDFRGEVYAFNNLSPLIASSQDQRIQQIGNEVSTTFAVSGSLVYHSFLGPVSLSTNYYESETGTGDVGVLFNIGYLIYNKRPLE